MHRPALGTDAKGAQAYLGCAPHRWKQLRSTKAIQPIPGTQWFLFSDLDALVERLKAERDQEPRPAAPKLHVVKGPAEFTDTRVLVERARAGK